VFAEHAEVPTVQGYAVIPYLAGNDALPVQTLVSVSCVELVSVGLTHHYLL
jgi:hypothetical protein